MLSKSNQTVTISYENQISWRTSNFKMAAIAQREQTTDIIMDIFACKNKPYQVTNYRADTSSSIE